MFWQYYDKLAQTHYTPKTGSWLDIATMLRNPITSIWDRSDIPLWSFYLPVAEPTLTFNGMPHCVGANFMRFHAMQIDYDDGLMTIDEFCRTHADVRYILYTSFRNKPEHNKFRVIIPLKWAFPNNMMSCQEITTELVKLFPGCDGSTFNTFRRQRIPAVNPEHPEFYEYRINRDGAPMDIDYFQWNGIFDEWKKSKIITPVSDDIFNTPIDKMHSHSTSALDKYESVVTNTQWVEGNRNNNMWSLIQYGARFGIASWDISRIMQDNCPSDMRDELHQMLKRI